MKLGKVKNQIRDTLNESEQHFKYFLSIKRFRTVLSDINALLNIYGHPENYVPSYLLRAHSDYISQLLYNEIDAFYAWFF